MEETGLTNSPMHTKEFQTLSESTNFIEASAIVEEIVEFVDVPTDVHPIVEVSCGTSCCPLCTVLLPWILDFWLLVSEVFFSLFVSEKCLRLKLWKYYSLLVFLLSLSWTIFQR